MLAIAWTTICKRPLWPILFTFFGLLGAFYLLTHPTRIFQSTGRIIVTGGNPTRFHLFEANNRGRPSVAADQAYRIKSDAVLNRVIRDLDLMNTGDAPHGGSPQDVSALHSRLLRQLKTAISVHIELHSNIITISYSSLDPAFSATLVNKVIDDFIQNSYEERFTTAARTSQWPAVQLARLKSEVQATQTSMIQVERRVGNTGFQSDYNRAETSLAALTGNVIAAQLERESAETEYRRVLALTPEAQAAELDALAGEAGELHQLRAELALDRATLAASATTLGPSHPSLRTLAAQVASLEATLDGAHRRKLLALRDRFLQAKANQQAREATLHHELATTYANGKDTAEYHELLRQFSLARFLYTDLFARLRTASIQAGLSSIQVDVLDLAHQPTEPLPTDTVARALGSVVAGFLAGCLISLSLQNLRRGVRNVEEVEDATSLPSLATLPRLAPAAAAPPVPLAPAFRNLPMLAAPASPFAEGMRNLRTNLAMTATGGEPKYVLFTSSTPSEGKTTVAGNYALALAERGERVLLIDADMHRPNLHHRFGFSGRQGLSSILSGTGTLGACVQQLTDIPCLDILPAGPVPPAPAVLLEGQTMLHLLREAGPLYRHIVIDSPPVMAVIDGVVLAQLVDAVVYVVRYGQMNRRVIRLGRDRLASSGAPLAGCVLNGLKLSEGEHWASKQT